MPKESFIESLQHEFNIKALLRPWFYISYINFIKSKKQHNAAVYTVFHRHHTQSSGQLHYEWQKINSSHQEGITK